MLENILKHRLKATYGDFVPVKLNGGYTNETFLLHGTSPPVVVKVAYPFNKDIQNEVNCLNLIHTTGLVPKIFDLIETDSHQITVMEYRQGTNGQSILDHKDLERAKGLYKKLAMSLSKNIHSKKYNFCSHGIRECNIDELDLNLEFVPLDLHNKSRDILRTINDVKEQWVLTHGDYGVHNVLYSETNDLTVLDWEWAEWANPLTDISWVCWFTKLHYSGYANVLNHLFIKEYQTNNPVQLTPDKLAAYCLYKVWKVLYKVKNAPVPVQQQWIQRLKWTIETDIFDFPVLSSYEKKNRKWQ